MNTKTEQSQSWHVARIHIELVDEDAAVGLLFAAGSRGTIDSPLIDGRMELVSYFSADQSLSDLRATLQDLVKQLSPSSALVEIITCGYNPRDENWKQHFQPHAIVPNVIIAPTWERYAAQPEEHIITLDPGMAFGTGLHESTQLCAELLAQSMRERPQATLLDVGCGSGILMLIGHVLGAKASGVDIDPLALEAAQQNLTLNNAADLSLYAHLDQVPGRFHIVVANILLDALIALAPLLIERSAPRGHLIVSGITNDQEQDVADAYAEHGWNIDTCARKKEWSALRLTRNGE